MYTDSYLDTDSWFDKFHILSIVVAAPVVVSSSVVVAAPVVVSSSIVVIACVVLVMIVGVVVVRVMVVIVEFVVVEVLVSVVVMSGVVVKVMIVVVDVVVKVLVIVLVDVVIFIVIVNVAAVGVKMGEFIKEVVKVVVPPVDVSPSVVVMIVVVVVVVMVDGAWVVISGKVKSIASAGIVVNPIEINSSFASSILSKASKTISISSLIFSSCFCMYQFAVLLAVSAIASVSACRLCFS